MIKGQLCTVRHVVAADLNDYIELLNDLPSRGEHFSRVFQSPEVVRKEFIATGFVTEEREGFVIEDRQGRMVGILTHFKARTPLCREIGYRLFDSALAGKGYVTEATRMLCDHLFLTTSQLNRLELLMDPDNTGSERIAQKLGFTFEGVMREAFFVNGSVRDTKVYSLLRREWLARRM